MFGFVAKHRGVWPVSWMCDALGVSRSGFHAWLTRPRSNRSIRDEELSAAIRASFLQSDRTYGARRVWHDLLEEGYFCGLHCVARRTSEQGSWPRWGRVSPAEHYSPASAPRSPHRHQPSGLRRIPRSPFSNVALASYACNSECLRCRRKLTTPYFLQIT